MSIADDFRSWEEQKINHPTDGGELDIASDFASWEQGKEGLAQVQTKAKKADTEILSNLPETLRIAFWDTDIPLNEEVAAGLVGAGHLLGDPYRGVKQMFGIDEESLAQEQQLMTELYGSSVGPYAMGGAVVGALAEPLGFVLPGLKAKKLSSAVAKGVGVGAAYGGLAYVNEEAGQTRLGNMAFGGAAVGLLGGVVNKGMKMVQARQVAKADHFLQNVEKHYSEQMVGGKNQIQITEELKAISPETLEQAKAIKQATGRTLKIPSGPKQAEEFLESIAPAAPKYKPGGLLDRVAGIMSTRVKNMSEEVFGRLRKYEYDLSVKTHRRIKEIEPFMNIVNKKLSAVDKNTLSFALQNGDFDIVRSILNRVGGKAFVKEFEVANKLMQSLGKKLQHAGRFKELLPNYWPRFVKDYDGLTKHFGGEARGVLDDALAEASAKMVKKNNRPLNPAEKSKVINTTMRGWSKKGSVPGYSKQRKIGRVDEQLAPFYADPFESIHTYIRNSTHDLEKLAFFGKIKKGKGKGTYKAIQEDVGGATTINVEKSVGELIKDIGKGKLDPIQQRELQHLLSTRFNIGEIATNRSIQDGKNIMYMGLLANPVSAITQLGDVGVAIYLNGFRNTIKGLVKREVKMEDFGIGDNLAEEFATTSGSARALRWGFKFSGFKAMDRLGKEAVLNSSLVKWQKLAKSKKGLKKLEAKYKTVMGDEYEQLALDLKNKKLTENVKLMLFNEISDIQPISLSEMPEMYLRMPNGRVVYMLKTFMLKQADLVRREAYQEIKKGNVAKGIYNFHKYALILGSANAGATYIKDKIQGKEVEPDVTDIPENFLKMFGTGEYMRNKMKEGKPFEALAGFVTPPVQMFDDIVSGSVGALTGDEYDPDQDGIDMKALRHMPIAGKMWYMWFGGGMEKAAEKKSQKEWEEYNE